MKPTKKKGSETTSKRVVKNIHVPILDCWFQIVATDEELEKNFIAFVEISKHGPTLWIKPNATVPLIAHEAVHVVNVIFKHCYVKLDIDNDEPQAYMTEWVVGKVIEFLDEVKKKAEVKS